MISVTGFKFCFISRWRMSVFACLVMLLFIRLGFWQLQRADEKNQMLASHQAFAKQKPIVWQPGNPLPEQYQSIRVQGHFLTKGLLLDNQHYQHQFGYHVITPLLLANDQVILIDRGWVAGDTTRRTFPMVDSPPGFIHLQGSTYYPSAKNWLLGPALEKMQTNLAVVELFDVHSISQFLHKSVYPFIIRLDELESNGFVREWAVVAMSPDRHYAYALQWFAMALVIFILFIVLNIKKKT